MKGNIDMNIEIDGQKTITIIEKDEHTDIIIYEHRNTQITRKNKEALHMYTFWDIQQYIHI